MDLIEYLLYGRYAAAGAAVARAAGCRVTDLAGEDLSYDPNDGIKRPGFLVYPTQMDATVQAVL